MFVISFLLQNRNDSTLELPYGRNASRYDSHEFNELGLPTQYLFRFEKNVCGNVCRTGFEIYKSS